jgi:hypothetical protein
LPIENEVRPQDRVVILTLHGPLAVADYEAVAQKIIADERVESGFGLVVDGRALDPLPNVEELRALVEVARKLRAHGVEPFALVADNDFQFVVGQLFATLAGAVINLDARVFRSLDVAVDWLRAAIARRREADADSLSGPGDTPTVPT